MEQENIRYLKGIGPRRAVVFDRLGVRTVKDLLRYFPYRYEDRRDLKKIRDIRIKDFSVISGTVKTAHLKKMPYFLKSKKVKSIFEIILSDDTGNIKCVWFNQSYLADSIKKDTQLIIYGKAYPYKGGLQMVSPQYNFTDKDYEFKKGDKVAQIKIEKIYDTAVEWTDRVEEAQRGDAGFGSSGK